MKILKILCVLCVLVSLSGCKYKNEAQELEKQNESLTMLLAESDSMSNIYRTTLREIETAFDSIMPIDASLDPASEERKLTIRLTNKLNEINEMFIEKEKQYNYLNNRLINSNKKVSDMTVKIEELNYEVRKKDSINVALNQNIAELEEQIAELSSQMDSIIQEKQILRDELEKKAHTAFFIAGSENDLRDKQIIEKTGGFLGLLGRVNTLNPKLDKNHFQIIDITEKTSFTLNTESKQIEFITKHPPESYDLSDSDTATSFLTIKDPVVFWMYSKYLVITF